jgi:hypothetical protein
MGISAGIGLGVEAGIGAGIAEGIGAGIAFEGGAAAAGALGGEAVFGGLGAAEAGLFGSEAVFSGLGAAEALGADAALTFGGGFEGAGADAAFGGSDLTSGAFDQAAIGDSFQGSDLTGSSEFSQVAFDQVGSEFSPVSGEFGGYQADYPVSGDWSQSTLTPENSSDIADMQSGQFGEQQVAQPSQTGTDPVSEAMQGGPAGQQQQGLGGGRGAAQQAAAAGKGGMGQFNPGQLLNSLMQMGMGKPSPPSLARGGAAAQGLLDQGNLLLSNYNQGILNAPMMAQIQLGLQGTLNKIRQMYASSGRYNSTDRIQAENLAYTQATASMAQALNQELTSGLQALGQAGSLFNQQAQIELQADTSYRNSLSQALGSILKMPFSGGGLSGNSGFPGQQQPSEADYASQQQYDYGGGDYGGDFPVSLEG